MLGPKRPPQNGSAGDNVLNRRTLAGQRTYWANKSLETGFFFLPPLICPSNISYLGQEHLVPGQSAQPVSVHSPCTAQDSLVVRSPGNPPAHGVMQATGSLHPFLIWNPDTLVLLQAACPQCKLDQPQWPALDRLLSKFSQISTTVTTQHCEHPFISADVQVSFKVLEYCHTLWR